MGRDLEASGRIVFRCHLCVCDDVWCHKNQCPPLQRPAQWYFNQWVVLPCFIESRVGKDGPLSDGTRSTVCYLRQSYNRC